MARTGILALLVFIGIALGGQHLLAQAPYDLPNDNNGCPANCRQIPWLAGSDVWNGGTLPVYPAGSACSGLTEGNGTSDNTAAINACISAQSKGHAAVLPAGMYYVNGKITLKAGVVLRGAGGGQGAQGLWMNPGDYNPAGGTFGSTCGSSGTYCGDIGGGSTVTTLKMGSGGSIFSGYGGDLNSSVALTGGYTKGSTSVTTAGSPGLSAGAWVVVAEQGGDSSIPTSAVGEDGTCTWCGENDGVHIMTQIVQVTSVSGSGPYTINLSRQLYYTFLSNLNPIISQLQPGETFLNEGVENMKVWGYSNSRNAPFILLQGCIECWVKGVETFNSPAVSGDGHVVCEFCYGTEIRDSYFHFGQSNASGEDYGVDFLLPSSDNKVENNIFRENRHGIVQEGSTSGNVFLYNYIDDMWTDDNTYLGSMRVNHGAHPYMNLWEGNVISHCAADDTWGTSSHNVLFRNWCWGDAAGNYSDSGAWGATNPSYGFIALEVMAVQHYYAAVGNVLGNPSLHTSWSGATLLNTACGFASSRAKPMVYGFGCGQSTGNPTNGVSGNSFDSLARSTAILHGNYDYHTNGVAFWDGGSNHALKNSMYYSSQPAFFASCSWPVFGPDLSPVTNTLPAMQRFQGSTTCTGGGIVPPTNLQANVN